MDIKSYIYWILTIQERIWLACDSILNAINLYLFSGWLFHNKMFKILENFLKSYQHSREYFFFFSQKATLMENNIPVWKQKLFLSAGVQAFVSVAHGFPTISIWAWFSEAIHGGHSFFCSSLWLTILMYLSGPANNVVTSQKTHHKLKTIQAKTVFNIPNLLIIIT